MPAYVVEVYLSRGRAASLDELSVRLRETSEELARAGTPVVYVCSVFLPEDETCFHFFEAASLEAMEESCSRLGLASPRITSAIGVE